MTIFSGVGERRAVRADQDCSGAGIGTRISNSKSGAPKFEEVLEAWLQLTDRIDFHSSEG